MNEPRTRLALAALFASLASVHATAQSAGDPAEDRFLTDRESPVELRLTDEAHAFTFAVFGDRTGGPANGVRVLARAVGEVNVLEPDLVMTVGDLVEGYNATQQWLVQAMEFRGIMDRLEMPWYPVAGNHDVYWRGPNRPPLEHEGDYETHFGPLWYTFEHKDCWFVALFSDETNPDTGKKDFGDPANHRMSPRQLGWLDSVLARTKGAKHVFVFLHHPRWMGGRYGDHWIALHERFVAAGNVTAVFAGHIHRMTYTERDGIHYYALATTGGGQSESIPAAGYLHHFDLVTVRDEQIAVATLPVGEVIDPRVVTEEVVADARRVADGLRPEFDKALILDDRFGADATVEVRLGNPVAAPIEVAVVPDGRDPRWMCAPDHVHLRIDGGEQRVLRFRVRRAPEGLDGAFDLPVLRVTADLLVDSVRIAIPERTHEIPVDFVLPVPPRPPSEHALHVDGVGAWATLPSDRLALPDGPLTVEAWFRAEAFASRVGLVTKTEGSEFGIFVSDARPTFSVHLGGSYANATTGKAFDIGRWHHVAGVFDGSQVRLYRDGKLVAHSPAAGKRTPNRLPLIVGADVDARGSGTSPFQGEIDEVRISKIARYAGESFAPARRFEADTDTVLLLHMDGDVGPWLHDASAHGAHPRRVGGARVGPGR